ncbi:MAG: CRISPR-associated endoribonuclease Cas6 [Clostridiaceae bacterium]|nr:CRISPR-associated endoribonuclease Cas6 [Clostridiaceae bacterium]
MRFKLKFELGKNEIPCDYRPFVLSFLKYSISHYDRTLYQSLYESGTIPKKYTFSVWLDTPVFQAEAIQLGNNRLDIQFSTGDTVLGIHMYNAFVKMKKKEFSIPFDNTLLLKEIQLIPEKIITDRKIFAQFISPLIVRSHTENKDFYYSVAHSEFKEELMKTLHYQLEILNDLPLSILEDFRITPIKPQKTVVQFYGQYMEATLGTFEMEGDPVLLDYFYKHGIGSKRSCGFGMLAI